MKQLTSPEKSREYYLGMAAGSCWPFVTQGCKAAVDPEALCHMGRWRREDDQRAEIADGPFNSPNASNGMAKVKIKL